MFSLLVFLGFAAIVLDPLFILSHNLIVKTKAIFDEI